MIMDNSNVTVKRKEDWYLDAKKYWEQIESTENGMLGGLPETHEPDMKDSRALLDSILLTDKGPGNGNVDQEKKYALDCGAGIGRISRFLLADYFDYIDLVEQEAKFVETARTVYLKDLVEEKKMLDMYVSGLQDFTPKKERYDVIWCQWVLSHLTDDDLVSFLKRCKQGLKANDRGFIVVKENTSTRNYVIDEEDSSVTRASVVFEDLFKRAGLKVKLRRIQKGFPEKLFQVKMWVLY